jgi:hypothetical protein
MTALETGLAFLPLSFSIAPTVGAAERLGPRCTVDLLVTSVGSVGN